jgi:hypothetical protein
MLVPLLWYITFGALHEAAHLLAALLLGDGAGDSVVFTAQNYLRAALARHVIVPAKEYSYADEDYSQSHRDDRVRHAGWLASVGIAVFTVTLSRYTSSRTGDKEKQQRRRRRWWWLEGVEIAAVVTAMEALQTDLLQTHFFSGATSTSDAAAGASVIRLCCGNFGIVLVNLAWATRWGCTS